ncbi:hypothetical protein TcasGA2_TC034841 [Tribolium castaneum]|uniref:Uncharacterized protein n=1 Tax=Tribolium castaneum TaxID=7070 RepID=A0A139WDE7_TRICA|nr:PREDICTED: uncharacterized protein LOC103313334 isoform X2 [Tribolium castaneum]KYB25887.1 hypothetical protein TcasGA2_TC034841 [Tribolium castaneum]|eukprot:XP_015838121.1 PREDICTED: uncharacterized protein LOC103313334 isoform X2 [Tribolium castaneum]
MKVLLVVILAFFVLSCTAFPHLDLENRRAVMARMSQAMKKGASCFGFTINVSFSTAAPATTAASG